MCGGAESRGWAQWDELKEVRASQLFCAHFVFDEPGSVLFNNSRCVKLAPSCVHMNHLNKVTCHGTFVDTMLNLRNSLRKVDIVENLLSVMCLEYEIDAE